jgi:hypothetical protein
MRTSDDFVDSKVLMATRRRRHAVVVGGSLAGILRGEHVYHHSFDTLALHRTGLGRRHAPRHQLPGERFRRRAAAVKVRLGDQLPEAGDVPAPRLPHRLVPQHQHRGLDLPRHARQLRTAQMETAHRDPDGLTLLSA